MSVEHLTVQYGEHEIDVSLFRRERKTLEIAVEPDATVSVPWPTLTTVVSVVESGSLTETPPIASGVSSVPDGGVEGRVTVGVSLTSVMPIASVLVVVTVPSFVAMVSVSVVLASPVAV